MRAKVRGNMPSLFGTAAAKRLRHDGIFHVGEAVADMGHRHTFSDNLPIPVPANAESPRRSVASCTENPGIIAMEAFSLSRATRALF